MSKSIKKAVFPVAGKGTRFLPATRAIPKELLPIVDVPLIEYAIQEALEAGIEELVFVTAHGKESIENYFNTSSYNCKFVIQEEALGLGHAVWCAKDLVGGEAFAVLLPDEFMVGSPGCLAQMAEKYNQTNGNILAAGEVLKEHTNRYGILEVDGEMKVSGMVEKPDPSEAPSNLAITGRYILDSKIFEFLEKKETGAGGEIQLTDAMIHLMNEQDFYAVNFSGRRFDCGNKAGFVDATIAIALEHDEIAKEIPDILKKYA